MVGSRPRFTEAEARRLQERVNSHNQARKTGAKESLGLYDQVDELEGRVRKIEKKVREYETRLDNMMVRIHKLEMR